MGHLSDSHVCKKCFQVGEFRQVNAYQDVQIVSLSPTEI